MFPILETDRLRLVEITPQHTQALFNIFSRDEVTQFYGTSTFTEVQQAEKMIQSFRRNYDEQTGIRWGITLKEEEHVIGTIGLNNLRLWQKRTEVGYDLHPDYWRKGYITEALHRVIGYCFNELDLFRIGAVTFPENIASSKLLIKSGFKKEGLLRGYIYQDGKNYDTYSFSLIKTDDIYTL